MSEEMAEMRENLNAINGKIRAIESSSVSSPPFISKMSSIRPNEEKE